MCRPVVIDYSLIGHKSSQRKFFSCERAVSVVWYDCKNGRRPLCNWNCEYNVAYMYHDWSLYLSSCYQEQTINMEPKKSATNSGLVCFFLVMHSLNGGGSNSVVEAWIRQLSRLSWRFIHADKLGDYYLIGGRNDERKHFGVNGLTWDSEPHIKLNFPGRTIMTLNSSVKCHLPSFKQLYVSQSSFPALLQFTSW